MTPKAQPCTAIGHYDFVDGPNGEPIEQAYYDCGRGWVPETAPPHTVTGKACQLSR